MANQPHSILDMYIAESDAISTWQQLNTVPPTGQLPSENIQDVYKGMGNITSMLSGGGGEVYDEEGNVIAYGGSAPDLAFAPFMSKKNLTSLLHDLKGGSKTKLKQLSNFLGRYARTPQDAAVNIGAKLSKELTPPIATKSGTFGYGEPTIFGKFLEKRSKKNLYKKLATKKEFEKFKNTFPNLASGRSPEVNLQQKISGGFKSMDFKSYKDWLKNQIFEGEEIRHAYGKHFFPSDDKQAAIGQFHPLQGSPGGGGTVTMASKLTPSQWGSTLKHELKHKLDNLFTGQYKSDDYYKLKKIFKDKMKPEPKKKLEAWDVQRHIIKGATGRDVASPWDVGRIEYLLDPTETLARSTQLKTKGIGQTISETLGVPSKPRRELEEIYTKEFIKE